MRFEYRTLPEMGWCASSPNRWFRTEDAASVGTITDFTDLVTARGDLHKAETLLRNTFDQAPIGIAYLDRSGRFLRFNEAFCALLGLLKPTSPASPCAELTHAEDAAAPPRNSSGCGAAEIQFVDVEKRYLRKDGSHLWVRTTTALVRDGSSAQCSVEYVRDITQRKAAGRGAAAAADAARNGHQRFARRALGLRCRGKHHSLQSRCGRSVRIAPPDPAASQPPILILCRKVYLSDGVTPVPRANRPLARALRGEIISNLELIVAPRSSRPPRTTLSNARRLIGPDGETLGAVAVIQDTTERKRQELELERVHKELMTASRQAGMAEVATNVLHNVGNILNSVNISASLVAERVRQSKAPGVSRLAALLLEQGERRRAIHHRGRTRQTHTRVSCRARRAAAERSADGTGGARFAARKPRAHQGHRRHAAELRQALRRH